MKNSQNQISDLESIEVVVVGEEACNLPNICNDILGTVGNEENRSPRGSEVEISEVHASSSSNSSIRGDIRRQISSSSLEDFYSCSEDGSENTYGTVSHSPPRLHSGIRVSSLDSNGHIKIMESNEIDHLMKLHEIDVSDLEMLGLDQDTKEAAHTIITKDNAFLIGLLDFRCLVTEDCLYLFDSGDEAKQEFLDSLSLECRRIAGFRNQHGNESINGKFTREEQERMFLPSFTFTVLKLVLATSDRKLRDLLKSSKNECQNLLSSLSDDFSESQKEKIIKLKEQCIELESTAKGVQTMLKNVLNDKDKLEQLLLSNSNSQEDHVRQRDANHSNHQRKSRHQGKDNKDLEFPKAGVSFLGEKKKTIKELTSLLERSLHYATNVELKIKTVSGRIHAWQESADLFLAVRSVSQTVFQLRLAAVALVASVGAMAAGIFGMNMRSNLEDSSVGFYSVVVLIVSSFFIAACICTLKSFRRN